MTDDVTLFPTCLGDVACGDTVRHARDVLRALGWEVHTPRGATCCGQPADNSGFPRDALRVARRTLRALDATPGDIAVPSGSCTAMIALRWPELFRGDRDEDAARRVASRARELTTVLASRARRLRDLGLTWEGRVGYHDSCHMLRELRVRDEPRAVLAAVNGLEVVPLAGSERCCGFGGTFAVRYPELSVAMADDKLADARAGGVDAVVSADPGCLLQLAGRASRTGAPLRALHVATLLHEAGAR